VVKPVFHVVVVSDRVYSGEAVDVSGARAKEILCSRNYAVKAVTIVPNNPREIVRVLRSDRESTVFVFIGGTGVSPRDVTVDVLEALAWRRVPGFGEVFRLKSFEKAGYRGLLSRAELYLLSDGRVAVALPGSPDAVKLGLEILLEMVEHLLEEAWRFDEPHKV